VQCDVWSVGLTMMEVAIGKFPFPPDGKPMSIFELLEFIINEPVPRLPEGAFSSRFEDFMTQW
jgi:mitogen-activated protein kinase kinase